MFIPFPFFYSIDHAWSIIYIVAVCLSFPLEKACKVTKNF